MAAQAKQSRPGGYVRRLQRSEFAMNLAGSLAARYIRAVRATSRIVRDPADTDLCLQRLGPAIGAMWHGQFLLLPLLRSETVNGHGMVSRHGDGEMIARVLARFDIGAIRGAGAGAKGKDRGGSAALRSACKLLRGGENVLMTAEIPPGPARVAGLGIVTLARMSGRPIVPLAIATSRFITLPTWSRFTINLPFSKLAIVIGEPIYVPGDADAETLENFRQRVEAAMNETTAHAYALAGSDAKRVEPRREAAVQRKGFLLSAYRGLTTAARPFAATILRRRAARGKEIPERLSERLGVPGMERPKGHLCWFHAASVGETNAILPLIEKLKHRHPELRFLLTTVTVTAARVAAERLPEGALHQFVPLDSPRFVDRFMQHWRPDLGLFTESEIWPNLIVAASDARVPLVLLNARMPERSFRRWARLSSLSRPVFSRFDLMLTQNQRIAKRLKSLGARQTIVTGNLKNDAPPPPANETALSALRRAVGDRPVFLAASTHPGEDEIVATAYERLAQDMPQLLAIIAPRHPARGGAIADLFAARHLTTARRSWGEPLTHATQIYLADTIGELGLFYALAPFSFIGGSLVAHGGQNPAEAVKLGSGVLCGPHLFNFEESYRVLRRHEGCRLVSGADELAAALKALFRDPGGAAEMKRRAAIAIAALGGALERTLEALGPYLPAPDGAPPPQSGSSSRLSVSEHAA